MAAPVITDHAKKLGQHLHLRLPHLQGAAERIRQHQGRSAVAAFDCNVEQATVGVDHRHRMFLVMRGLDPRIYLAREESIEEDGLPGQARQRHSATTLQFYLSSSEASSRSISACE